MPDTREQLLTSTFWSIRRPKFPLTEGHFVVRLNDPGIAFCPESATDLLHCYGELRRALTELVDASAAQLYISRNWQPVGGAVGEPLAETSTPSLHVFCVWPGSPTPATALARPAHQRAAVQQTQDVDDALRTWLASSTEALPEARPSEPLPQDSVAPAAPELTAGLAPEGWANLAFHVEPAPTRPGEEFRTGHWRAAPRSPVESVDQMSTAAILELVQGIEDLAWHSSPRHVGMSVWATDHWGASTSIDIFAREHGNDGQLAAFVDASGLDLPLAERTVGTSPSPSPTLEK